MAYHVRNTSRANHDFVAIFEWLIEQHAGEAGMRWLLRMQEEIETLGELPYRCALAPETKEFSIEVRHLIYGKKPHFYRILYTVKDNTVFVLHIRHGRRLRVNEAGRFRAAIREGMTEIS